MLVMSLKIAKLLSSFIAHLFRSEFNVTSIDMVS